MKVTLTRAHVIQRAKKYNALGIATSLSYLPVRALTAPEAQRNASEYIELFDEIRKHNLDSDVTIKLPQFGIEENVQLARENLLPALNHARRYNVRTWFDQVLQSHAEDVISLAKEHPADAVGVCLQAYHQRTIRDVELVSGYPVRLVKGFYNDNDIRSWPEVTQSYSTLMDIVALKSPYPCFATHDLALIEKAKVLLKGRNGEIQFFAGVRDELAVQLVREGYKVRVYIPYGPVLRFLIYGLHEFDLSRAIQRILGFKKIN